MAATLEKIYEVALHHYHMKLVAGSRGLANLVDFNRELCNLIYRSEQEQDNLESAIRKAVFAPEEKEQYLPVLARDGIHADTELTMIQCYVPFSGEADITGFYYRFLRQCQQILTRKMVTYVVFHHDKYVTIVMTGDGKNKIDEILKELQKSAEIFRKNIRICLICVGGLSEKKEKSAGKMNLE